MTEEGEYMSLGEALKRGVRLSDDDVTSLGTFMSRVDAEDLKIQVSTNPDSPVTVLLNYRSDGVEYTLAKMGKSDLWFWGRSRVDAEAPLLAARSLGILWNNMQTMREMVASGVAQFADEPEGTLQQLETLCNPQAVRSLVGGEEDPKEISICAAGIARLTLEQIRERRRTVH